MSAPPQAIAVDRIACHRLLTADPEASIAFYTECLGMRWLETVSSPSGVADDTAYRLAFPGDARRDAVLELVHRPGWAPTGGDKLGTRQAGYWKIGITLSDVERAAEQLRQRGVAVTQPAQFQDIGFLCHLRDPDGHGIELLQHRFETHFTPHPPATAHALLSDPTLAHVTLRVADVERSLAFYLDTLGLYLVARQDVASHRFSLYFLSAEAVSPPTSDWRSTAHREWLWQRPHTLIELQHVWPDAGQVQSYAVGSETGFLSLGLSVSGVTGSGARSGVLRDPDGYCLDWSRA